MIKPGHASALAQLHRSARSRVKRVPRHADHTYRQRRRARDQLDREHRCGLHQRDFVAEVIV